MGAFDQTFANKILDTVMSQATWTATVTTIKCKLMVANGSATSAGTELSGGSYVAGGISVATWASASAGSKASSAAVTQTNMPAATTQGVELFDSAGTPVRIAWGALAANKTTSAGDTFTIASGSLSLAFP